MEYTNHRENQITTEYILTKIPLQQVAKFINTSILSSHSIQ